jgi:hypothetical protein
MSIKYDSRRIPISEVIKSATHNATYLIPDLQRQYVWTPRQVILLIDSLFRGWPFGTLLLWEIKPDCYAENEGIPHRLFWQVVDRTGENEKSQASLKSQPTTYYMVLDGQQRVQSLILALGGDTWGFKLFDHDWADDLRDRKMRNNVHWSMATLCFDVEKFKKELQIANNKVRNIEVRNILDWVIPDIQHAMSDTSRPQDSYEHPLSKSKECLGRYIRLSSLWDAVQKDLSESDYREIISPILIEHAVQNQQSIIQPLAEFMKIIESVKNTSFVHVLQIESFTLTPQWGKDDYNDAIVNIFTRLNTAGRTLTREEITLAWLKVGWKPEFIESKKTAGDCLDELVSLLDDKGLEITSDEAVRLLSFFWAVLKRDGGSLLSDRDLLKGNVIRPMAEDISREWKNIIFTLKYAVKISKDRELLDNSGSFNALLVVWCWLFLADRWGSTHNREMRVRADDDYCMKVMTLFEKFIDRWVFSSQWANIWAVGASKNLQDIATELSYCSSLLENEKNPEIVFSHLFDASNKLILKVSEAATKHISDFSVNDRSKVSQYRTMLWVWHRLDNARWENSRIIMRRGRERKDFRPEVDHTIADAYWKRRVEQEIKAGKAAGKIPVASEGVPEKGPGDFETRQKAVEFINTLGNCALLKKGFNISKSNDSMWNFLKEVHEFKNNTISRGEWENALDMSAVFTSPNEASFEEMETAIRKRDQKVRSELVEFIDGKKERLDI